MQGVRTDIDHLAGRGLDLREFSLRAARVLRRAVSFDGVCVLTTDPATRLPTCEITDNGLPPDASARMTAIELGEPDFNKFAALDGAAALSAATGGDLDASRRHRELKAPHGFGDELRLSLGRWGGVTLLREAGRPHFEAADVRRLASLAAPLTEGVRRATLGDAHPGEGAAGLVLLAPDGAVEVADAGAGAWLDRLQSGVALRAVATRALAGQAAAARVRTAGGWIGLRATLLGDRVAVMIQPAEMAPLLADAYELTERERAVTQLVARGHSTDAIAGELFLSPYTVQDHLKAIFEKVGVSSRGELVARLFFGALPRLS